MAGRPKRQFSTEEIEKITEYALNNCHVDTIALALGIAKNTIIRHYGTFIKQKRAEGRIRLRNYQNRLAKTNPAMAIFLGKNELDQTDKQEMTQRGDGLAINITEARRDGPVLAKEKKGA